MPGTPVATASSSNYAEIDLTWSASTDNVAVQGYDVFRDGTLVTSVPVTTTTYADIGLAALSTHTYTVAAIDGSGNTSAQSAVSNQATTIAGGPDVTAPSVPGTPVATASASNYAEIDLTWTGSTDNVAVQGYLVYRDGTLVTSVPVTTTAYADIGLAAGSTHTYTVAALDEAANVSARSAASNAATTLSGVKTTSYAYDLADRLLSIGEADGTSLGFTYDALGRHATRYSGATTIDAYSYAGGSDAVVADVPNAGSTVTSAIDAAGNRLASSAAGSVGWLLADLHGDLAGQTSATGVLIDAFRYDAYGRLEGTLLAGSAVPTPWRYQGRLLESTSGNPDLYDFAARTYAPDLGTFLSLDVMTGSLIDPVSLNRYLYAEANPETLTDPDGHCTRNNPDCTRTRTEIVQDNARHQSQYLAEERAKDTRAEEAALRRAHVQLVNSRRWPINGTIRPDTPGATGGYSLTPVWNGSAIVGYDTHVDVHSSGMSTPYVDVTETYSLEYTTSATSDPGGDARGMTLKAMSDGSISLGLPGDLAEAEVDSTSGFMQVKALGAPLKFNGTTRVRAGDVFGTQTYTAKPMIVPGGVAYESSSQVTFGSPSTGVSVELSEQLTTTWTFHRPPSPPLVRQVGQIGDYLLWGAAWLFSQGSQALQQAY